jgi:hypothetical protein
MTRRIACSIAAAGAMVCWIIWSTVGRRTGWHVDSDHLNVDLKVLTSSVRNSGYVNDASIPENMRLLDGKKVALEGFVEPDNAGSAPMRSFTFVYSSYSPWGKPGPTERVFGTVPAGIKIEIKDLSQEVRVLGTLHVGVHRDRKSGHVDSIFRIDVDRIEPI